jgi:UDP-N-acetylmuramyl pentapeptide phosphotransferase/UDP-N-acetylglucosamine-1-phosphate transferase
MAGELQKAFQFGTPDPYSVEGFSVRFLLLAIPAILLGHLMDELILLAQKHYKLHPLTCLVGQTIVWVAFFLLIHNYLPRYGSEFQSSYAGLAFVTLFFTVQTNYVTNLQAVIRIVDRTVA